MQPNFKADLHKEYIIQPNEQGMTMKFASKSIVSEWRRKIKTFRRTL